MKHVVLDTEVFRRENLAFDTSRFARLTELVNEGEVEVYLTDVVVEEVRRAISEQVRAGVDLLRQEPIRRTLNLLAQGGVPKLKELLKEFDPAQIATDMQAEFATLLHELGAEVIPTDDVSAKELRDRYFKVIPPFGHKLEKKHEFPDAMTALAIEAWSPKKEGVVYVVSGDKGIAAAVQAIKGVTYVAELREIIDLVLRGMAIAEKAEEVAEALSGEIEARVKDTFEDLGFYIEGEWAEVSEVAVTSVSLGSTYVGEIDGDVVTLEFEADVQFTAEVGLDDPDQTAYDSETGDTIVFGTISKTMSDETWVQGEMEIKVNVEDLAKSTLKSLWLHQSDISLSYDTDNDVY